MRAVREVAGGFFFTEGELVMELNEREKGIIQLADDLLKRVNDQNLDEATIDANFIFRFEPGWCRWVSKIRGGMRRMLGKTGDDPLSIEDGVRWWLHIDSNAGLSLSVQLDGENTIRYINTDHGGGYSCLDESLQSQIDKDFDLSIGSGDRTKQQHNFMNMWYEANQTSKIISEIERMARAYNLIPSKSESKYSSRDVRERMWRSVVNWVIWGEFVPEFRWGKTIFSESNRGEGIERTIRLLKQPEGSWHNADKLSNQDEEKLDLGRKDAIKGMTNDGRFMRSARLDPKIRNQRRMVWKEHKRRGHKRMTKETRIRTWAIYFLTKRGGGRMSEEVAVDTWNDFTWSRDPEAPTIFRNNYQVERNRLFSRESTKKP